MNPFIVRDCTLLLKTSGIPPALNLRELRDRLSVCSTNVLYHHFSETSLRPSFDDPEYHNDFALWTRQQLGDRVLAERLGMVNPFSFLSLDDLRTDVLDLLDERLSEVPVVTSVLLGHEFYFMESTMLIFDTGETVARPEDLHQAVARMTNGSIFFHFLEARRRPPYGDDDFTAWLRDFGGAEWTPVLEALKSIDIFFSTLAELRVELARALRRPRHE